MSYYSLIAFILSIVIFYNGGCVNSKLRTGQMFPYKSNAFHTYDPISKTKNKNQRVFITFIALFALVLAYIAVSQTLIQVLQL